MQQCNNATMRQCNNATMCRLMKGKYIFLGFAVVVLLAGCSSVERQKSGDVNFPNDLPCTFMFYNVENLFHPSDDSLSGDDPFTPAGEKRWTYSKYNRKINAICKVILAAGEWEPPLLIGLCELENDRVLKDLIYNPLLIDYNYKFLHRDSPDHRGIDVALLYREDEIRYISHSFISNCLPDGRNTTREILHGEFALQTDTIDIYVNHWTSKYGGAYETEKFRVYQARLLSNAIDSLLFIFPQRKVLVAGDFNDNSSSASIEILKANEILQEIVPQSEFDSYKYQGKWESIDHFFVVGKWNSDQYRSEVFAPRFLLEDDVTYTGLKPFRTYAGYSYNGGISDHLPILLHFNLQEAVQSANPVAF